MMNLLVLVMGCTTVTVEPESKPLPAKPIYREFKIKKMVSGEIVKEKGVFLTWDDYQNLLINNEMMWGYIEKLEDRISPGE